MLGLFDRWARAKAIQKTLAAAPSPFLSGVLPIAQLPEPFRDVYVNRAPQLAPYAYLSLFWSEHARGLGPRYGPYLDYARRRLRHDKHAALDLCCGTGLTARTLLERFDRVYCVDRSPEMLGRAEQALGETSRVRFSCADMTDFRVPEPVQVIVCAGDSINYLPDFDALCRMLEHARVALSPRGLVAFDVLTRAWMRKLSDLAFHLRGPSARQRGVRVLPELCLRSGDGPGAGMCHLP